MQFIKPQLATLYDGIPAGKWLLEVKFDGYRMQINREKGNARFFTRSGLDWVTRFSFLGMDRLPADIIVDGELVSVEPDGRSNFSQLQADLKSDRQDRMTYYAFDVLYLDGRDLRGLPQVERKKILKKVLRKPVPGIHYSEHHTEDAKKLYAQACKMNLEGLIAKNPKAPYRSERNENWLKLKCVQTDQFIIVGYVPASAGPGVGALRLATKDLQYVGKVGTGFTEKVAISLRKQLDLIKIPKAPIKVPKKRNTTWVEPKLVAKVEYRDITDDGMLRHPSFKGLA